MKPFSSLSELIVRTFVTPSSCRPSMLAVCMLLALLTATFAPVSGQNQIVTGRITDDNNVSIAGPTVCQVNTTNCTNADMNGIFHLLLEPGKEMSLQIRCLGFNPVEVVLDQSTVYPLKVVLIPAYMPLESSDQDTEPWIVFRSAWSAEALSTDFGGFSTALGSYNTEAMDLFAVTGPELGVSVHRIYTGFRLGMGSSYSEEHDTLIVDLSNTAFSLNLGYDLISTQRIRMTPLLSVKWMRLKLRNYRNERKIPLSQYLDERDLELRFNQVVAVAGVNLEYLIYNNIFGGSGDYWSLGVSGGYAMKLNRTPWIYSRGNRLITDNQIGVKHFTFGISVSFYTNFK